MLLHLTPEQGHAQGRAEIVEQGRRVGKEMLVEALDRVPSDRRRYLHDAIEESEIVEASPILDPTAANGDSR